MADVPYCGSTVHVVAAKPATDDVSGFAALTWTAQISSLVDISPLGDTSEDVPIPYLSGRVSHVNGGRNGGEVTMTYAFDNTEAGQVILRAQQNTNTVVSLRVTDIDGRVSYVYGVIANVQDLARTNTGYKGQTAVLRVQSPTIRN